MPAQMMASGGWCAALLIFALAAVGATLDFSLEADSSLSEIQYPLPFVNASGSVVTDGWDLRIIEETEKIKWTWNVAVAEVVSTSSGPRKTPQSHSGNSGQSNYTVLRQYWVETIPTQDFQSPKLTWVGCAVFLQDWKNDKNQNARLRRDDCSRLVDKPCQMSIRGSLGGLVLSEAQTANKVCKAVKDWFSADYPSQCGGFHKARVTGLVGPGMSKTSDAGHGSLNKNAVLSEVVELRSEDDANESYDRIVGDSTLIMTVLFNNHSLWRTFNQPKVEPVVDMVCLAPSKIARGSRRPGGISSASTRLRIPSLVISLISFGMMFCTF